MINGFEMFHWLTVQSQNCSFFLSFFVAKNIERKENNQMKTEWMGWLFAIRKTKCKILFNLMKDEFERKMKLKISSFFFFFYSSDLADGAKL